jgi:hypothetical protein
MPRRGWHPAAESTGQIQRKPGIQQFVFPLLFYYL